MCVRCNPRATGSGSRCWKGLRIMFNFIRLNLRYSLAFLNVGFVVNDTSFVHGCSFNDGFNTAVGVYGTDNLSIKNNVIHHGVNELVEIEGHQHTLQNNLIVLSLAEGTYKVSITYNHERIWKSKSNLVLLKYILITDNIRNQLFQNSKQFKTFKCKCISYFLPVPTAGSPIFFRHEMACVSDGSQSN